MGSDSIFPSAIACSPQAEYFVSKVKTSSDPRITYFNLKIYNKFIREGFRRMPPDEERGMTARDEEWKRLYEELRRSLKTLGIENAYGDADYWLVDDDYGDTTHKVCVHRKSFLKPALIAAIQKALRGFPQWCVMVQLEFPIADVPDASSGVIIYPDAIEEHWDRKLVAELVARLGL